MESGEIRPPAHFRAGGIHCGIKPEALDLAVVWSESDVVAAGVYTQNRVVAAPVRWCRQRTPSDRVRAVVINSGNANACTGERGTADTETMARWTAEAVGAQPEQVLVMSTGIIGEFLPMAALEEGIPRAVAESRSDAAALGQAARAILTTDRVTKTAHREVTLGDRRVMLTGMAKGAGMIGPRMATMLAVILTDAKLSPETAQRLLRTAVDRSFHCISVDGHTSTNDSVVLLAAGDVEVSGAHEEALVGEALETLAIDLAKQIPADGEGATHLVTIRVTGAPDREAAHQVARTIADSPLVKTAMTGADPNWGRIVSAAGYAGVPLDPDRLKLRLCGVPVFEGGVPLEFDEVALRGVMRESFELPVELNLGMGKADCTFWTSDLTHEYITINAEYHT